MLNLVSESLAEKTGRRFRPNFGPIRSVYSIPDVSQGGYMGTLISESVAYFQLAT